MLSSPLATPTPGRNRSSRATCQSRDKRCMRARFRLRMRPRHSYEKQCQSRSARAPRRSICGHPTLLCIPQSTRTPSLFPPVSLATRASCSRWRRLRSAVHAAGARRQATSCEFRPSRCGLRRVLRAHQRGQDALRRLAQPIARLHPQKFDLCNCVLLPHGGERARDMPGQELGVGLQCLLLPVLAQLLAVGELRCEHVAHRVPFSAAALDVGRQHFPPNDIDLVCHAPNLVFDGRLHCVRHNRSAPEKRLGLQTSTKLPGPATLRARTLQSGTGDRACLRKFGRKQPPTLSGVQARSCDRTDTEPCRAGVPHA